MMSTSRQDLKDEEGGEGYAPSAACRSGEQNTAATHAAGPAAVTLLPRNESPAGHCYTDRVYVPKERWHGGYRQIKCSTSKRKSDILCSLSVVLCFSVAALCGFVVHLQFQVRDLTDIVQTLHKNFEAATAGDDSEKLLTQFEKLIGAYKSSNDDDNYNPSSSDAFQQLLRRHGFSGTVSKGVRTSKRRSIRNEAQEFHDYVVSIVDNHLQHLPKVHLRGLNDADVNERRTEDRYLVWQLDDDNSSVSFVPRGVVFERVNSQRDRIKSIRVRHNGVYVVYSQVIVNGTNNATWRRDCAHQTVIIQRDRNNPRRNNTVLMSGFVTQDSEGFYPNSSLPYPRDSSLQMGIFRLLHNTEVAVWVPDGDCRRTLMTTDLHSSYFGLFKIA